MTHTSGTGAALESHRRFLWALTYRLTGSAADADDVVQETFARALERPPADTTLPWRPWLTRVAVNLGRDLLRRRRRTAYSGPWLPQPIETEERELQVEDPPQARYDLVESMSFAFLVALEALSPPQRAVLLLRDVFDYSVAETAGALGLSEANVKTTHHRARRAMAAYDRGRMEGARRPELTAATRRALESFAAAVASQDVAAVEALLADQVRALSDGGGEYLAARVPILGRSKVAATYVKLARVGPQAARWAIRLVNGLPALILESDTAPPGQAPRSVLGVHVEADGRIGAVYSILASDKLSAIRRL